MTEQVLFHLDDCRIAQMIFKKTFENSAEILSVQTIKEAETILQDSPDISCFVIDYNLKYGNGLDFIKTVRSTEKYKDIPIILLSSTVTNDIAYKAMEAGANESVAKITIPEDLRKIVFDQIENPAVKVVDKKYYEFWCAIWEYEGKHYQYCPYIKETVGAKTAEEAAAKMRKILEEIIYIHKHKITDATSVGSYVHRIPVK